MLRSLKVFVVEDNEWYNKLLTHNLSLNPEIIVKSYKDGNSFLKDLSENPDIVTLDYRLPDTNGAELLKKIKSYNSGIGVIIISEQEDIDTVVSLLKDGATDYIVKTKDIRERLFNSISLIGRNIMLDETIVDLRKEVNKKYDLEHSIIGESEAIKSILDLIEKACKTNIIVSLSGETGTGKELAAKAIHNNSKVKNGPFVAVNMAAIPADLIESEMFGHEKGSFTGAVARRIGKFEEATGGTLFLDEIGEINKTFQAKLLRAIQESEITRVGGNQTIKTNCRIIVATNRDLSNEVKHNRFRKDLYYRLLGLPINLPPLRKRNKDVLLLSKKFMLDFCESNSLIKKHFSEDAISKILSYSWPGNIRELKSVIELAVVMTDNDMIKGEDILLTSGELFTDAFNSSTTLREYNRQIIKLLMKQFGNDTKAVAKSLKIGQTTVYRLLKEEKNQQKENK